MKRRMLALLLMLCMVVSLLPAQMVVAEGTATDLDLDANQLGTFTPDTSGTYVFYDTNSQNENSSEWSISVQYANGEGEDTYTDVAVAVNDTYTTRGYRAELTAGTTYLVVVNNNSNRTLSIKVAPATYGGAISFSKEAEMAAGAVVNGEWGLDVVPVAPNGVLGQIHWRAVVSATDDTSSDCVQVTANGDRVTLNFVKEGTFTLKAVSDTNECSKEITVEPAPYTMGFVAEGAAFTVYPRDGEAWSTNGFGENVEAGKTLRDMYDDLSTPIHQSEPNKQFAGWMVCTQDSSTGEYIQIPGTQILGLTDPLDYPASANYITYFVAQWSVEEPPQTSNVLDLGTFPVGVPTAVELPIGEDPSTGASLPDTAVATFTPANTAMYTLYYSVPANGVYDGQQIRILLDGQDVTMHSTWYNADKCQSGVRLELTAGEEYRFEFQGHTTDVGGITYTLKEVVTPDTIYFPFATYEGYENMGGVNGVCFAPVHGYAPVTYTVEDSSVAEAISWGGAEFKQAGQTTIHATCGNLTASAEIIVKSPESLKLDKETKATTGAESYWLVYRFLPTGSGDYTFRFSGLGNKSVSIEDTAETFYEHWFIKEGQDDSCTVTLEKDVEYILRVNTDYTQTEYTASVTFDKLGGGNGSLLVALDGYHGDPSYGGGKMTLPGDGGNPWETGFCVWEWASEGQTIAQATGLSSMPDPKWDGMDFEGWLLYREDGDPFNGPSILTLESRNILSTADMLAATVPSYNIRYVAKWAQIDWEYYENIYDPYYGVGGGEGGEEGHPNIHVGANEGTISYIGFDGIRYQNEFAYSALLKEGECLADCGFKMTDADVKYWTERAFKGWRLSIVEPIYDENGDWIDSNWEEVDGLFTTQEVIDFKIPDGRIYEFYAQYAGDDSDYMAYIFFDGRGADILFHNQWEDWHTKGWDNFFRKDGTTIGQQMDYEIKSVTGLAEWGTFEGWLTCEQSPDQDILRMLSTTVYTTQQIMDMKVERDLQFVPKWSGVALEEYEEVFDVLLPFLPTDGSVIDMQLDVKYDVTADKASYFTFTAPADGAYSFCTDAQQGIVSELMLNIHNLGEEYIFDGGAWSRTLQKGETLEIKTEPAVACKLWVTKINEVTKMEVVSQDKTTTYLKSEYLDPSATLGDVQLKLTFDDGTTETISGTEFYRYGKFYKNLPGWMGMELGETTATIILGCCDAEVQYQVNLKKNTVVKFEAIPAPDMFDVIENTLGREENGVYVYEDAFWLAYAYATYKFTWSDGTVETFQLDMENMDQYYNGVYVGIGYEFDPVTKPWTVGTNYLPISYGELSDELPVVIKKNNVKSIEMLGMDVTEYTLGDPDFFVKEGEGWYMDAFDMTGFSMKVTYTDGTSKTFTERDVVNFRDVFGLLDNIIFDGIAEEKLHTEPGKSKLTFSYAGCTDDFEINIVEQAVVGGNASVSESTMNELVANRKGNTVTLSVEEEGTTVSGAKFPTAAVDTLLEEKVNHLVVELGTATITLDEKALTAIADQAEGATITLAVVPTPVEDLTGEQQDALKNKNVEVVLTALILSDGKPIGDFKGGSVKVKINFKPEKGYNYMVVYVADDGTITEMTTEVDENSLAFWTGHFSDYVVVKEKEETTEPTVPETTVPETTVPETTPEETTKPVNPAIPNTGDNSGVTGMMLVMLASGTTVAALWLALRKRNAV